jgi:SsrA-binding protein
MIINNRKAKFLYSIIEEFTAGMVLHGSEVKSIRSGNVTLSESFIIIKDGEVWIKNMYVTKYKQSHKLEVHDENRDKKLLLNKKEIDKISKKLLDIGTTVIPLGIFISNNKLKLKIAVAKGKKNWDKKQSIKEKDIKIDLKRNLNINLL